LLPGSATSLRPLCYEKCKPYGKAQKYELKGCEEKEDKEHGSM
jgi:hypothetical protein